MKEQKVLEKLSDMAKEVKDEAEERLNPQKISLDEEDKIRLENMILRERVAEMSSQLAKFQCEEKRQEFQNHIISKHDIDITKTRFEVNPQDNTVILYPR